MRVYSWIPLWLLVYLYGVVSTKELEDKLKIIVLLVLGDHFCLESQYDLVHLELLNDLVLGLFHWYLLDIIFFIQFYKFFLLVQLVIVHVVLLSEFITVQYETVSVVDINVLRTNEVLLSIKINWGLKSLWYMLHDDFLWKSISFKKQREKVLPVVHFI